jgi:hypothetical protein
MAAASVRDWGLDWGSIRTRSTARSGTVAVMDTTDDVQRRHTDHLTAVEATEEAVAVTGGGLRIVELGIVTLLGLLVCPPFFILAVVVAVPVIAVAALVAGVAALIAVPTWLVRRVRAHHREHGSTLFLHRLATTRTEPRS